MSNVIPFERPDDDTHEIWQDVLADMHERLATQIADKQPWDDVVVTLDVGRIEVLLQLIEDALGDNDPEEPDSA